MDGWELREPLVLERIEVTYDFDGYVWVRTLAGELCGPYDSIADAVEDGVA